MDCIYTPRYVKLLAVFRKLRSALYFVQNQKGSDKQRYAPVQLGSQYGLNQRSIE